jgi:hypothetical protein
MGNYIVHTIGIGLQDANWIMRKNTEKTYGLQISRLLDNEHQIHLGVGVSLQTDNKELKRLSSQVIRIGDYTQKYYHLLRFTEQDKKLKYEFENEIMLILKKTEKDDDIHLELFHLNQNLYVSTKINQIIIKCFTPISFATSEFDKIYDFFADKRKK